MASITFTSAGGISATSFTATSSKEKKDNIIKATLDATSFLKDVDVVNFTYKEDPNQDPHIGFIAEYTDELLATPRHDQMDLGNCIGVLIKAVQELSERVKLLEEKLDEKPKVLSAL